MKLKESELIKVSGAIMSSYINNFYLEECKRLGVFRQTTKKNVNKTINDLIEIENHYFNEVYNSDVNDLSDTLVANNLAFIDEFLKFDFNDFCKLQEVFSAYRKDPDAIAEASDKVLKRHGAKDFIDA